MKLLKLASRVVLILCVLLTLMVIPVLAQTPAPEPVATADSSGFSDLLLQLGGLAGFASLLTLLINVGKAIGFVKDGTAPLWSAGGNILLLIGLLVTKIFNPSIDLAGLDSQVANFVQVGVVVLAYVLQLLTSKGAHFAVSGVPLIGKSYTLERAKAIQTRLNTIV